MSIAEIKSTADDKMHKSLEALKMALSKIRTGRPTPGLLDHVHVDYYGSPVPISQVANVTLIDSRTLGVSPWERQMAPVIDKAIRDSDLGLNPVLMGELIRVPMPALSEERRKELTKVVRGEGEHAKVAIRNLRREANDHLKRALKDKEIAEDEERRAQDDIQKLTDRNVAEVDKLLAAKEQEIMTV
jgi:ribosome recycling factor